ncbi:MAG: AAA family ATPase [Candidatus Krumholzibacteria bacterium]|nr:AAA family ATPase [Candidatus Krumholzibacteria bacterium]
MLSTGQTHIGREIELAEGDLLDTGADYIALGHIHKHQRLGGGKVVYAGSLNHRNFGEVEDKGYLLVGVEREQPPVIEFRPTPCRRMVLVEFDYSAEDDPDGDELFIRGILNAADDAEVRCRMRYPEDQREAALACLDRAVADIKRAGACSVTPDPVAVPVKRVRNAEIAQAQTPGDKFLCYCRDREIELADDRRERLLARLADLAGAAGAQAAREWAPLHLRSLRFAGWNTLREEQTVDLDLLGDIVAVYGPNGAGKSTFMELILAALYRETPSYGAATKTACSNKSFVDARLDGHRLLLEVNATSDKQEAYIYNGDGQPLAGPKVRDFDAAVARVFPPQDIVLASSFAAQNRAGDVVPMRAGERKALLAQLLGLDWWERLAEAARAESNFTGTECTRIRGRIEQIRAEQLSVIDIYSRRQEFFLQDKSIAIAELGHWIESQLAVRLSELCEQISTSTAELDTAQAQGKSFARQLEDLQRKQDQAHEAATALNAAMVAHDDLDQRRERIIEQQVAAAVVLSADADILRAAEEQQRLEEQRAVDLEKIRVAELELMRLRGETRVQETQRAAAEKKIRETEAEIARLIETEKNLDALLAAAKPLADLEAAAAEVRLARMAQEATLDKRRTELAAVQADARRYETLLDAYRNAQQRSGLVEQAACGGQGEYSRCPLIADAVQQRARLADLRADMQAVVEMYDGALAADVTRAREANLLADERHRRELVEEEEAAANELAATRALDGKRELLAEIKLHITAAVIEIKTAALTVQNSAAKLTELAQTTQDRQRLRETAEQAVRGIDDRLHDLCALTNQLPALERALAQRDGLTRERADLDARARAVEAEIQRLIEQTKDAPDYTRQIDDLDVACARARMTETRQRTALDSANAERGKYEEQRARALAEAEKAQALDADVDRLTADLDDWNLLADACGRRGIPALEIDQAGPGISALANELLQVCFGSRFALSLETTRLSGDGKKTIEDLVIRVVDNERGRDGDVSGLSGGEQVIVREALSLAIAIFNGQRSGVKPGTLFRDECSGALDGDNARRYLAMLRKALEIGRFRQLLFIAHQPELWELADSRLHVADGRITVE